VIGGAVIVIMLPLVALTTQSASYVFTNFELAPNTTGISSKPYAVILSFLVSQYSLYGYDAAAHLTEETKGADKNGPIAILGSLAIISDFAYLYDPNNETAGAFVPAQILYDAFHGRYHNSAGAIGFVTNNERALEELYGDEENNKKAVACLNVMATRVASVFASLREFPFVRFHAARSLDANTMTTLHDLIPTKLAAGVWDSLMKYKKSIPNFPQTETCELLIIDRTIDQIAPLIHEWTYDAMCHDLLNMEGNKYVHEIPGKNGGQPERKEVLLEDHDPIWLELRYAHIADASVRLHEKMTNFISKNKAAQIQHGSRQPKWGHLKDLHKAIKLCEEALIATDPTISSPGPNLETSVYKTGSACVAFLANTGTNDATVTFNGNSYHLPGWSVSILPDCKSVVLNTAKINSASTISSFATESVKEEVDSLGSSSSGWSWISEPVGISKDDAFTKSGLLEQINTTADRSDYLWYSLSIDVEDTAGAQPVLHIESLGHALNAFINGKLAGSGVGNSGNAKVKVDIPITLVSGKNKIDLLSLTVGLQVRIF
ncbi:hypothetical protein RYX36_035779, partial [Vicia faba]